MIRNAKTRVYNPMHLETRTVRRFAIYRRMGTYILILNWYYVLQAYVCEKIRVTLPTDNPDKKKESKDFIVGKWVDLAETLPK